MHRLQHRRSPPGRHAASGGGVAGSVGLVQQQQLRRRRRRQRHATAAITAALPGLLSQWLGGAVTRRQQQQRLDDATPELSAWLLERGGADVARSQARLVAQLLPNGQGRGLVAAAPLRRGELALCIPEQLLLTREAAAAASAVRLPAAAAVHDADWAPLALFLAQQRAALDRGEPGDAAWGPYLTSLPRPPVGTVLDWRRSEVDELLAGSGLLAKARAVLDAADALWADLEPLTAAGGGGAAVAFTRADVDWAVGVLLSRSVRLDDRGDGGEVALVPWADLLNHSVGSAAYLVWDEGARGVVLRADRDYAAAGEQVFISYGPKTSGDLLLNYGFCPAPGTNPHDAAFITLQVATDDPLRGAKLSALSARGIPSAETFAVRVDALPAGLVPYAAFCASSPPSAAAVDVLAAQLFDAGDLPQLEQAAGRRGGVSSEQLALEVVADACRAALRSYASSDAEDRAKAAEAPHGGGFEQRVAAMAGVRVRERQILARTEFIARQRAKQLRRV